MKIKSYPRFFISLLLLAGFFFLLGYMAYITFFVQEKTYKAIYDELNIEKDAKAIVIRHETLVSSENGGTISWLVKEGDKAIKSQKLAVLKVDKSVQAASVLPSEKELSVNKISEMIIVDLKKIDHEMLLLAAEINQSVDEENYKRIVELKKDLELKMERKKRLLDSQDLIKKGANSFKKSFLGTQNVTNGDEVAYYSSDNGIVTFLADGLESLITLDNLYNVDYEILLAGGLSPKQLGETSVTPGMPIMKLVDQSTWFLVALIEKEEIDSYEKNKQIGVTIKGRTYAGTVSDVFENNKKGALIIKMNEVYEQFHTERFLDVKVIRENYKGIKIKRSSIITVNGVQGVYIAGADQRAVFRTVKILGNNEEDVIVKGGYIQVIQSGEAKRVKTIDAGNQVVINPSGIREGVKIE